MDKIQELDIWLSGADSVLGPDWYPSKEQWVVIREKIRSLAKPTIPTTTVRVADIPQITPCASGIFGTTGPSVSVREPTWEDYQNYTRF